MEMGVVVRGGGGGSEIGWMEVEMTISGGVGGGGGARCEV